MTPSKPLTKRSRRIFFGVSLLVLLVVFIVTWHNVSPAAPHEIVIFAGTIGTGHYEYGKQCVGFLGTSDSHPISFRDNVLYDELDVQVGDLELREHAS